MAGNQWSVKSVHNTVSGITVCVCSISRFLFLNVTPQTWHILIMSFVFVHQRKFVKWSGTLEMEAHLRWRREDIHVSSPQGGWFIIIRGRSQMMSAKRGMGCVSTADKEKCVNPFFKEGS